MSSPVKKWTVYRRGEALGTFTAPEIREQLRKGALSTGDFAAAEGSAIQQEVIEIDEIFFNPVEGRAFLAETPRRSRWVKQAEALNFKSAPPTRPRPGRLDPVHRRQKPGHQRVPGGQRNGVSHHSPAGSRWILPLIALLTACAAAGIVWLFRRRG